jgi:hypothetical protein
VPGKVFVLNAVFVIVSRAQDIHLAAPLSFLS